MNSRKSISSFLWTILIVLGIIFFWRQIAFLILFFVVLIIGVIAYFYFRGKSLSDETVEANKRRIYETRENQHPTQSNQTRTQSSQADVIDAEFTVKSKEID